MKRILSITACSALLACAALAADAPNEAGGFEPSKVTISFKDQKLSDALAFLSKLTGNAPLALPDGFPDKPLTIELKDVTYFEALDAICKASGLSYEPLKDALTLGTTAKPRDAGDYCGPGTVKVIQLAKVNSFRDASYPDSRSIWMSLGSFWEDRLPVVADACEVTRAATDDGRALNIRQQRAGQFAMGPYTDQTKTRISARTIMGRFQNVPDKADSKTCRLEGKSFLSLGEGEKTLTIPNVLGQGDLSAVDKDITFKVTKVQKMGGGGIMNMGGPKPAGGKQYIFNIEIVRDGGLVAMGNGSPYGIVLVETGLAISALSLLVIYLLAIRLQRVISQPIAKVADTARAIAHNKTYDLRVPSHADDEIGDLIIAFNHMLSEIQDRDESLLRQQERLERKVAERTAELARTNDELALAAKISTLGYWEYDVETGVFTFNDQYYSLHFATANQAGGYRMSYEDFTRRFVHPEDAQRLADHIQLELDSSEVDFVVETEIRTLCIDSSIRWMRIRFKSLIDEQGRKFKLTGVSQDITEKKRSEETIWQQANFDPLTGLPNRRMFQDRLEHEIKKSHRDGLPLALMFIDLDKFKEVNDTLGHDKGDILLTEAARRIARCVRESDTVARLGGDEFTVILSELEDTASVERIAHAIIGALVAPFRLGEENAFVSASIGITLYPNDAANIEMLMSHADQAMYASKSAGRNRFSYFTPSLQEAALNRMRLINDLRGAVSGDQFHLHYHPIVELSSGSIHKAEALIRWQHPVRGMISPGEFIKLAEESGMIIEIGDWAFRKAAQQVRHLRNTHHPEFQISINKSPIQFHNDEHYFQEWLPHLQQLGLPGQSITIEITEGLLLDATTAVQSKLLNLRDAGIQVALDDFGTGYSSLSYLKKFDIDYIKIDRSFVRNLTATSDDMALCEAIIVMAHKLGLKVIAEGIETSTQRHLLAAAGCDYGQGHFFSQPLPPHEFETLLQLHLDAPARTHTSSH